MSQLKQLKPFAYYVYPHGNPEVGIFHRSIQEDSRGYCGVVDLIALDDVAPLLARIAELEEQVAAAGGKQ